jgi:pimeloyl-ACP methyl ester carboxylesterase
MIARRRRRPQRRRRRSIGDDSSIAATTERSGPRSGSVAEPPAPLAVLCERFDREAIDVPRDRARIRLVVESVGGWDFVVDGAEAALEPAPVRAEPDAVLTATAAAWRAIGRDVRGGMNAFRGRRLRIRKNLHLGVGLLAATSGVGGPGRLRFERVRTAAGEISILSAGVGDPIVCIHGLGATKASFLPTVAALADSHRVIALDLPGFGDSVKPLTAAYDAAYFARSVAALKDALELERAHLVGNSMGGRVAIELALLEPDRADRLVLLSPTLAWLRDRRWRWLLPAQLPRLGLIQPTPRAIVEPLVRSLVPGGDDGWAAAGVDEFLRAYLDPRGRAAFYTAARNIYMDEPHGESGLWTRMAKLAPDSMFVWGRRDNLVPSAFSRHVERVLPAARHLELDCGHVPQFERPRETHAAIRQFFAGAPRERVA